MALQSVDNLIASLASSKEYQYVWQKTFATVTMASTRWYDMSPYIGSPTANLWSGTSLACQNVTDTTGFGIPHGGNVSPLTKHLLTQSVLTSNTSAVPGFLVIQDMQCYWPGINMNSNAQQNLTGTPTLRYANGEGCRLYLVITTTTGASAHNLSASYTNQAGTTGRAFPATVYCTSSAVVSHLTASGSSFGPYLPLAAGDSGVQNVANVTLTAASGAGTAALVLARPLAYIPVTTANVACALDYLNILPSLPVVKDGACLTMLYIPAANASAAVVMGTTGFVWG